MKKRYRSLFLVPILLMTFSCQSIVQTDNPSTEIRTPSETALPFPTITLTTQYPTSTVTTTPSPILPRLLPKERISIENAASLEQLAILGDQYTFISRGFTTLLSPSFDIYAAVENPDAIDEPLQFTIRDASSEVVLHTLTGDAGTKFSAAFSQDGRFFALGNDQGMLSIWNVSTGERILQGQIERFPDLLYSRFIDNITFSPDSNLVVTTSYSGRLVALWDLSLGKRIAAFYCYMDSACIPLVFSPDGKYFVTKEHGRIDLFDGKTGLFVRGFARDKRGITAYAFSPQGDVLAVLDRLPSISIYRFPEGEVIASMDSDQSLDRASAIIYSPDGTILANSYNTNNSSFALWDAASLQPIFKYSSPNRGWYDTRGELHGSKILTLTFSPDGTLLATGSYDNSVTLWGIPSK